MLTFAERGRQLRAASRLYTVWIPAFCAVYLGIAKAFGYLGPEHFALVTFILLLCAWSDESRALSRMGLAFLLYAAVYDSMRWYADLIRSPVVHVREPYAFDARYFGIPLNGGRVPPPEYLQHHTMGGLDFLCGLAYTPFFFIGESVALALFLHFTGARKRAARFAWTFFFANLIGFSFYYVYPAAPPWYVADHGFTVDLSVRASAAGALRFDQFVGLPIMRSFYGKSADVFGAIPSLHVVYPFLSLVFGWPLRRFRPWAAAYFALVCFSAMYLNHHYVIDILVGLTVATATTLAGRALLGAIGDQPRVSSERAQARSAAA